MRKIFLYVVMAAGLMTAAACNTVAGAGQDIEAAGDAVTDTAQDAQN